MSQANIFVLPGAKGAADLRKDAGPAPASTEFADFEKTITYHTMIHAQFDRFFGGFRSDAHPMAIMTGAVGALSAFYHDSINVDDPKQREISAHRLIAKMPTIAARGPFEQWQARGRTEVDAAREKIEQALSERRSRGPYLSDDQRRTLAAICECAEAGRP